MSGIIYKFENIINGKVYIGQTVRPKKRYWEHCSGKEDSLISKAIQKYGIENFKYEVLETVDKEHLNDREIYWIEYYNSVENGYNLTYGGNQNIIFSENTRKKMSESHTGIPLPESAKEKLRDFKTGKACPESAKKKLSEYWKNYWKEHPYPEERRKKCGNGKKGRKHTEEEKRKISESVRRTKSLNKKLKIL